MIKIVNVTALFNLMILLMSLKIDNFADFADILKMVNVADFVDVL